MSGRKKNTRVEEVCARTGLGYGQVWRLARKGLIPAQAVGRRFIMSDLQLEQLLRDGPLPEPKKGTQQTPANDAPVEFVKRRKTA